MISDRLRAARCARNDKYNEKGWKKVLRYTDLFVEFSSRYIFAPLRWQGRRGVQRELKTWLKILRCGRKWISDTRNATLFGTITRESPSKPPISIQPLLEIYLLDQKVLTCDLAPAPARSTGWHVNKEERELVIFSQINSIFPQINHANTCYLLK